MSWSIRACTLGATDPCAGNNMASGIWRTRANEPRKSPSGFADNTGSKPIDGVIVGST